MNNDGWDMEPVVKTTEFRNERFKRGGRTQSGWPNRRPNQHENWRGENRDDITNSEHSNSETVTIEVPSKYVGRIIGRGGSKINDLQFESGAKINVTKQTVDSNTIIELLGNPDEIEKAKVLINDLTVERAPRPQFTFAESQPDNNPQPQKTERVFIDWQALAQECDQASKEKWAQGAPIKKHFYSEHPSVAAMTPEQVSEFRQENNNIVVSRVFDKSGTKPIPNPVRTFQEAFHNYPLILEEIRKAGFERPSPIQAQAWPVLLIGEDLIGIAQTGTGKTLAFLLPAFIHIDEQPVPRDQREGPSALVIAPTRELALQIDKEVKKYSYKGITAVCIYGGGSRKEQVNIVTKGVDIVIATPGRLNDLVQADILSVKGITYVVLDEADRMLDMGFEPQIRKVLYDIRPDRQTVMTSATWPMGVRRLADSYMDNPIQIFVGSLDLAAVHTVTQTILMMSDNEQEKYETFLQFVQNMQPDEKVIVFCGKKMRADYLSSELILNGIDCQSLHGDREQVDREQAVADISSGVVQILIATDVASRGLDIQDVTHVINYDFPRNIEEYVHRVGRTGRAGRFGQSISYFTRADWSHAKELIAILEEANQYVQEELYEMSKRYDAWKERKDQERSYGGGGGGGGRSFGGGGRGGFRSGGRW